MNNDRFLTRVFDKQEKKMIYPGDDILYCSKFLGVNDIGLISEETEKWL